MFINLYVRFTQGQHAGEVMPMVRRAEMMLSRAWLDQDGEVASVQ